LLICVSGIGEDFFKVYPKELCTLTECELKLKEFDMKESSLKDEIMEIDNEQIEMEEEYQREKNKDYALDNMTNDLTYNEETGEWVSNE
tara:strand:+ start:8072 stop:8338 length:267 start_codon:yes stop_codon:yes gene_type:complete